MLLDVDIGERLSYYCRITKQTQERAANQALRELLERAENDRVTRGAHGQGESFEGSVGQSVIPAERKCGKHERMKVLLENLRAKDHLLGEAVGLARRGR